MGYPGKVKFPIISNHFAECDHKGEQASCSVSVARIRSEIDERVLHIVL